MGRLEPSAPGTVAIVQAELRALSLISPDVAVPDDFRILHHHDDRRSLVVTASIEVLGLEEAHEKAFGIRRWRHIVVSVRGQNAARLADQNKIGRQRRPGERSPVPLPDWYDLTHLAYGHAKELGIDPYQPVYQILPRPGDSYVNIAEALHLRQPA